MKPFESSEAWEFGLEDAQIRQLHRTAKLSFPEMLVWLEEVHQFRRGFARVMWANDLWKHVHPK